MKIGEVKRLVLTNNPRVIASYPITKWINGSSKEVLIEARRMVHECYPLLSHPLMGDIHLIKNPYRTILFGEKRSGVDLPSLIWIEESIARISSIFMEKERVENQRDYQIIDFNLFRAAIENSIK